MYSQEYTDFAASLNELQMQVIAVNAQQATAQARIASTIFRNVEAKMTEIAGYVGETRVAESIAAACQKFKQHLFEIVKLTKQALTEKSNTANAALASAIIQACTHMLTLEIIRRNYENTLPPPVDENAERRRYLEEQEQQFQAERLEQQRKAKEVIEAKVREEKARKAQQDREREARAKEDADRKREAEEASMKEENEIRARQERARVERMKIVDQENARKAAQEDERQRKAREQAEAEETRLDLLHAQDEVARMIQQERARLDAQERSANANSAEERARVQREAAVKQMEEERLRKAKLQKENSDADQKLSEERARKLNELMEKKAQEEAERRAKQEAAQAEYDKERERKAGLDKAARAEREQQERRFREEKDKADTELRQQLQEVEKAARQERDEREKQLKLEREEKERIQKQERDERERAMRLEREEAARLKREEEARKKQERERELKEAKERRNAEEQEKKQLKALENVEKTGSVRRVRMEKQVSDDEGDGDTEEDAVAAATSSSNRKRAQSAGTGDKWAQMMAKKNEDEFHADRERIRGRRGGGQKFVDDQIRTLIKVIKQFNIASSGIGTTTFGVLFKETSDSMPALAATLLQAKKRNIVAYDGDMLMQGTHDSVEVSVLTEHVAETKIYRSGSFNADEIREYTKKMESQAGPTNCFICSKTVYPTEKVVANDNVMHKSCFRCVQCSKVLKLAAYAYANGKFYCEPHFQQQFSEKGYNF